MRGVLIVLMGVASVLVLPAVSLGGEIVVAQATTEFDGKYVGRLEIIDMEGFNPDKFCDIEITVVDARFHDTVFCRELWTFAGKVDAGGQLRDASLYTGKYLIFPSPHFTMRGTILESSGETRSIFAASIKMEKVD